MCTLFFQYICFPLAIYLSKNSIFIIKNRALEQGHAVMKLWHNMTSDYEPKPGVAKQQRCPSMYFIKMWDMSCFACKVTSEATGKVMVQGLD